ncbi:MAG: Holliday junction branch migration protein RuvA [Bacteroidales bacterium]|nr:Holliday junction branch migration protein RuvA [Bacteroidales bacterium]
MIEYIKGKIAELTPAELILECSGIGYSILISLQSYQDLQGKEDAKVFIYHYLHEDDELYYGFSTKDERELFKLLISVSGIGASTARMMLSSLSSDEIREAILSENVKKIQGIKGIGSKTAQRVILELKDKIVKGDGTSTAVAAFGASAANTEEAERALIMLGFTKQNVQKAVEKVLKTNPTAKVEDIIKAALKIL